MTAIEILDADTTEAVETKDVTDKSEVSLLLEKKSFFADPQAAKAAVAALEAEVVKLKEKGIDCSIAEVDKDSRLRRRQLISLCSRGDEHRKDMNAPHQRVIDANNKLWKEIEPRIRALVPVFDNPIKAEEKRKEAELQRKAEEERQRVATLKAKVAAITNKPVALITASAETLAAEIDALEHLEITAEDFQEFAGDAMVEREGVLATLRVLHTNKVASEAAARQAEEQRIARERAEAEAAEQAKKQAEELAALKQQLEQANAAKAKAEQLAAALTGTSAVEDHYHSRAAESHSKPKSPPPAPVAVTQEQQPAAPEVVETETQAIQPHPPASEIIGVLSAHYHVSADIVIEWLCAIDLSEGL
ncbi:hypothetical protein [Uliginosibacterium sediminicola]|uniref:Uncharacterized protein n=1 Tax=Uliginosibacterium sediminicola TaxID=2024550 RepID=A0ABU9YW45_9RHOO